MSAILDAASEAVTIGTQLIPLASIRVVRNQRHYVGDVTSLADSVRQHGLLQPIVVSPDGDDYVLVAGERRLAAVTSLGYADSQILRAAERKQPLWMVTIALSGRTDRSVRQRLERLRRRLGGP